MAAGREARGLHAYTDPETSATVEVGLVYTVVEEADGWSHVHLPVRLSSSRRLDIPPFEVARVDPLPRVGLIGLSAASHGARLQLLTRASWQGRNRSRVGAKHVP